MKKNYLYGRVISYKKISFDNMDWIYKVLLRVLISGKIVETIQYCNEDIYKSLEFATQNNLIICLEKCYFSIFSRYRFCKISYYNSLFGENHELFYSFFNALEKYSEKFFENTSFFLKLYPYVETESNNVINIYYNKKYLKKDLFSLRFENSNNIILKINDFVIFEITKSGDFLYPENCSYKKIDIPEGVLNLIKIYTEEIENKIIEDINNERNIEIKEKEDIEKMISDISSSIKIDKESIVNNINKSIEEKLIL